MVIYNSNDVINNLGIYNTNLKYQNLQRPMANKIYIYSRDFGNPFIVIESNKHKALEIFRSKYPDMKPRIELNQITEQDIKPGIVYYCPRYVC